MSRRTQNNVSIKTAYFQNNGGLFAPLIVQSAHCASELA